jgi:hypothetical protein
MVEPVTYGPPVKKAAVPPLFTGVRGRIILGNPYTAYCMASVL